MCVLHTLWQAPVWADRSYANGRLKKRVGGLHHVRYVNGEWGLTGLKQKLYADNVAHGWRGFLLVK